MKVLITALALLASAGAAAAAPVMRVGPETAPISTVVTVPAGSDLVFVSGTPAPPPTSGPPGDTEAQTVTVLTKIEATLKAQGLSMADVVMMHVFLVGVPSNGGHMDFAGMMTAYKQFFGTAAQPNKPSRTTVQVAALGQPQMLVEIDAEAARTH